MTQQQKIVIDWGNTRVKVGIFQNLDRLFMTYNFSHEDAVTEIMKLMQQNYYPKSLLCSVHKQSDTLIEALKDHGNLEELTSETKVPIINAYGSWDTLGMDRLALAVGGHYLYPNNDQLVIAAGTAITYNFTQAEGIFRGGNISPGIQMRLKSLHEYADQLPLVSENGMCPLLGHDTQTSIRSGVLYGVAAEVESMINYYKAQYPNINVVITGGAKRFFVDKMKSQIFADDALILRGLNAIINYNENN